MGCDAKAYHSDVLEALLNFWPVRQAISGLAPHSEWIRQPLEKQQGRTISEACQSIAMLTGVKRRRLK